MWYNKCVDLLTVSVTARESAGEPYTLVEIVGEADVTNTDDLRRLLDEEVSQQPRTLIIDLSGLRFMDSSALHALLRVNRSLDRQGGVLALVSPQAAVANNRAAAATAAKARIRIELPFQQGVQLRPDQGTSRRSTRRRIASRASAVRPIAITQTIATSV